MDNVGSLIHVCMVILYAWRKLSHHVTNCDSCIASDRWSCATYSITHTQQTPCHIQNPLYLITVDFLWLLLWKWLQTLSSFQLTSVVNRQALHCYRKKMYEWMLHWIKNVGPIGVHLHSLCQEKKHPWTKPVTGTGIIILVFSKSSSAWTVLKQGIFL